MSGGAAHARFGFEEVAHAHGATAHVLAEPPDIRPRSDIATAELSIQHRSTGEHQRRQVAACGSHEQRRSGFVAAGQKDHTINRICANGLFHIHADKIAEEHRRGTHEGFAKRHYGELQREATCFIDSTLDVIGDATEVRVAWRQL